MKSPSPTPAPDIAAIIAKLRDRPDGEAVNVIQFGVNPVRLRMHEWHALLAAASRGAAPIAGEVEAHIIASRSIGGPKFLMDHIAEADTLLLSLSSQLTAAEAARREAEGERDFYRRRCDLLGEWQSKMRDPERKILCDILANGATMGDYGISAPQSPAPAVEASPAQAEEIKALKEKRDD